MATRFYFSSTATSALTPGYAAWTRTSEGARYTMSPTKDGSAMANVTFWANAAAAANDSCLSRQFISDPMNVGVAFTTSHTIKCQILCMESAINDNINRQPITVKVVSQDGNTLRATLLALGHIGPNTTEWIASPTLTNKRLADGDALTTGYTTAQGDRLVIEVGGQVSSSAGTSVTGTMRFGSSGGSDLGENETDTTQTLNPWFEISTNIVFQVLGTENLRAPTYALARLIPPLPLGVMFLVGTLLTTTLAPPPAVTPPFRQKDWPILQPIQNEPIVPRALRLYAPPVVVAAPPFSQEHWPSLKPPPQIGQFNSLNLLENTLQPTAPPTKPYNQDDWQVLKPLPTIDQPFISRMSFGEPVVPPAAPPFKQSIWPRLIRPPDAFGDLNVLNLSLGTKPFSQSNWPTWPVRPTIRQHIPPNLTIKLPPPPAAPPFKQRDWPRLQRIEPTTATMSVANLAIGNPTQPVHEPFHKRDWRLPLPIPLVIPVMSVANLAIGAPPPPPSLDKPFHQDIWPRLIQPPKIRHAQISRLSFGPPAVSVVKPFAQNTWPRLTRLPDAFGDLNVLNLSLAVPVTPTLPPFVQDDWQRLNKLPSLKSQSAQRLLAGPPAPFRQTDWPRPPKLRQLDQFGFGAFLNVALGAMPVGQASLPEPLPIVTRLRVQDPPNLLGSTLTPRPPHQLTRWAQLMPLPPVRQQLDWQLVTGPPLPPEKPFSQNDWKQLKQPPSSLVQFRGMNLALLEVPEEEETQPFNQRDWPAPQPLPDLEQVHFLLDLALREQPFVQSHWPLPFPYPPPLPFIQLRNELLLPPPLPPPPKPFLQSDWPTRQVVKVTSQQVIHNLLIRFPPPAVVRPFKQTDWARITKAATRQQPDVLRNNLLLHRKPFKVDDWPLAKLLAAPLRQYTALNLLGTTLGPPFRQMDWPRLNPAWLTLPQQRGPSLAQTTMLPGFKPHMQTNWPNISQPVTRQIEFKLGSSWNLALITAPPPAVATGIRKRRHWRRSGA